MPPQFSREPEIPVLCLEEVVATHAVKVGRPEFTDQIVQFVRNDLRVIPAHRDAYLRKHRGKTVRDAEIADLFAFGIALAEGRVAPSQEQRVMMADLCSQFGKGWPLNPGDALVLAGIIRQTATELSTVSEFKLDRGWRPYLYGVLLPKCALRNVGIEPTTQKNKFGLHCGPCIDFIRACLRELDEEDAQPETIARELKKRALKVFGPPNLNEMRFTWQKRRWVFDTPRAKVPRKKRPPRVAAGTVS